MIPILIAFLILILFFFLIFPCFRRHPDRKILDGLLIAHRGLHNNEKGIPENSILAFNAAIQDGYAIETDIHITLDGEIVAFHDDDLMRMCGVVGSIEEMTLEEIRNLGLIGTNEKIPTLKELLELVNGKVPLMIEIKCPVLLNYAPLCRRANEILKEYKGKYFIQSFYPPVLMWYRKNAKNVCRGQLSSGFYNDTIGKRLLGCLIFNFLSRPDFISYEHKNKNNIFRHICILLGAFPVGWTFESQEQLDASKKHFKTFIFEKFNPHNK